MEFRDQNYLEFGLAKNFASCKPEGQPLQYVGCI